MENPLKNPNFRRWFGRSKVVDKSGNPLVVYHGTVHDNFNIFDPTRSRSEGVIYFAENPGYTKHFSVEKSDVGYNNPRTYPCYLKVENPLDMVKYGNVQRVHSFWVKALEKVGLEFSEEEKRSSYMYYKTQFWGFIHSGTVIKKIREKFDGIRMKENFMPEQRTTAAWVVFEPTQIKSAIGNRGTYDPQNPDIRESLAKQILRYCNEW